MLISLNYGDHFTMYMSIKSCCTPYIYTIFICQLYLRKAGGKECQGYCLTELEEWSCLLLGGKSVRGSGAEGRAVISSFGLAFLKHLPP